MEKSLKIAVIGAKGLPPTEGGIEHYCAEVYPRIFEWGNAVDLYARAHYTGAKWFEITTFKGVRVISLPGPTGGVDALTASGLGALMALRGSYDIVHFHALGPALFSGMLGKSKAKVVVTCHGLDWQRDKWSQLASQLILAGERAAVNYADALIVVSKDLQSYFLDTYRRATTHITTAPASYVPADPEFEYGKSLGLVRGRYIVFLGRLVPEKRPDLLVEAFSQMAGTTWKLVIVGGNSGAGSYREKLFAAAMDRPDIIFTGHLQGAHLSEIVEGAGLFVLPSDLEGLPLSLLEAMRAGIPAIASNIPPHQEVLDGDRGLLFRAGSVSACREALERAIGNLELMAEMAAKATTYINTQHSWEKIAAENLDLYHRLLLQPNTYLSITQAPKEVTNLECEPEISEPSESITNLYGKQD